MFIINDHNNYMTTELLKHVIAYNIKLFIFLFYLTHLLKSLNIKVF